MLVNHATLNYLRINPKNFLSNLLHIFLIISLIFSQNFLTFIFSANDAKALTANGNIVDIDHIVPDGSTNTITDRAPNNTPIVNIAAPSGAGVSLNNFTDFNVTNENAIFNNSGDLTINTNLAGVISGNQNLIPSGVNEADIIIGQVTGTNRTQLNGFTEIAGRRAELVLINQNGINISGAGFINTSRLSLITGVVNMNNGNIVDFSLSNDANSNIIITGVDTPTYVNLGLDASQVDYVDIISRFVEVSGDIFAGTELNIKTGNEKYSYDTKEVISNDDVTNNNPTFGLDSSHLGGMYAGKIKIISSKKGVGVRARGDLVSNVSDIDLEAKGDIEYERLQSANNINVTTTDHKITQGLQATADKPSLTYANNNINLTANNNDIELNGEYLFANNIINLVSTNKIVNNTELTSNGDINITANNFTNNKRVVALRDLNTLIYNDLLNQNGGLLFAGNNINMQVNSGLTNDASEIYAFNNIYLNGEKYQTDFGNVSKYDFFWISFDKSDEIWDDLIAKGWIDADGNLTDAFKDLSGYSSLTLDSTLSEYQENIYRTLNALSLKIASDGEDFQGEIQRNFDDKADDIYNALKNEDYIDGNDELTQKFYDDTKDSGAQGLDFADIELNLSFKDDVYNLLVSARTGLIIENIFLNIDPNIDSSTLISNLKNNGYIDDAGNVTSTFTNLASYSDLNIDSQFDSNLQAIYSQINSTTNIGKVVANDFNSITSTANDADLFNELVNQGYIDNDGNIQGIFTDDINDFNVNTNLSEFKDQLFNIVKTLSDASDTVELSDLNNVTATLNQSEIITYLTNNEYIDNKGNVNNKYYTDGLTITGALAIYQGDVNSTISSIQKESLNTNSFKKINKSLDSSVDRLISELKTSGYIDDTGKKTDNFNNLASSSDLSLGDEFSSNQTLIYNTINGKDASYALSNSDFLGGSFDSNTFFDENQELFDDLVAKNYLSANGDVKQAFYNLNGDYSNLSTDSKFAALQDQIGALLSNISQANTNKTNLTEVAQNNTKTQAGLIFNKLYEKGYINVKGDYTQKLMDEVLNYSANDVTNYNQLHLDDLQEHAEGIYNSLKVSNGILDVMTAGNSVNNINGGRIESLFGDIFIKTKDFNNIGKDSADVNSDAESNFINRVKYRNISSAWKNVVLDGYDRVSSILTADESYLISANNIDIETNNFLNNSSWITAGNNMNIRATDFKNKRTQFSANVPYIYEYHHKKRTSRGHKESRWWNTYWRSFLLQSNTASILSSGNNLTINAINNVKNDIPTEDNANLPIAPDSTYDDVNDASNSKEYSITLPSNSNGLFRKADPTSEYLVETNLRFLDPNILTGSRYFKDRFGYDPNIDGARFLGDPFYEWKVVNDQIRAATKKQKQWDQIGWTNNLNQLIDNAYEVADDLELVPGIKLTADQIANLNKDIIWYEEQIIDGQLISTPTIYLSNNSFNNFDLNDGSMILAKNVIIKSDNVINQGNLLAENSLDAKTANNITNEGGNIYSQNELLLASTNDINNKAVINTLNIEHLGGTDIFSNLARNSIIKSDGAMFLEAGRDINNYGANIESGSDMIAIAGDDINIGTLAIRDRSESITKNLAIIKDITKNLSSNIKSDSSIMLLANGSGTDNEASTSDLGVGSSILVSGSNISALKDLSLSASNNAIITNAVNKDYSFVQRTKKGSIKTSRTSRTDYVETAVNSNLTGKNINITTNNNIYVQGSNLNSVFNENTNIGGNTKLNAANDTTITNATIKEYHHTTKEVSNRGLFKGLTAITSAMIDIFTLPINLTIAVSSPVLKNTNHPLQKALDKVAPDFVTDNLDYDKLRNKYKDAAYNNQYHNTKIKTTTNNDLVNIVSSNVSARNNLFITSTNNTTVQASNLNSGYSDIASTNIDVTGSTTINTNNLDILAAANYNHNSVKQRTSKTMAIRNNITGNMITDYTNSNLTAKNDGFIFNVMNQADIRAKDLTDPSISQPSYIAAIKAQIASDKINETNLEIANKHWEETTRELTEAGTATIAITAVAATIATGGAALGLVKTAVAAAAAATASTTAASTSMNNDGDFWKQAKTISKDTWDATTSREAFENYAIAAGTTLLTAGLMDVTGLNEVGNAAQASANSANAATNTSTSIAAYNYMQAGKALGESAISTVSSTAAQASVKGISFSDAIKEQGTNILVGAVANVGAKHIGVNYKTSAQTGLDKAIQLTSHAALGAGISYLSGNDALSGAVSGVVGEVAGEAVLNNFDVSETAIKEIAGLAGGYSAIFTGNAIGLSDSEVSDNMFSGQRIGKNAAENNLLLNIGGAIVGGVAGASGAAYSAVISGKEGTDILKAAAIGSGVGLVSGALLNPNGIVGAMTVGSFSGGAGSGIAEYRLNENPNFTSIANATIEGAIAGSLVSGSTFLFTPAGSGVAGKAIGVMTSAPIDFTLSTISTKYDLIQTNK